MMMLRDLKAQYTMHKAAIDKRIAQAINDVSFIFGPEVEELERRLAQYAGVKHCISCANGTDALQLVLMAWGIGEGDAVFTSDFTFFASAGSASIVGATPVFVDIDLNTFNVSPVELEKQIVKTLQEGQLKPKVIIPVDLFGQPANYAAIEKIAQKYGLRILEDGAQGFGGAIQGRRVGSFGEAATTSFFPSKPLGCYGDGGAIFTNDSALSDLLRSLRAQGRSATDKYDNRLIGMNSRLDTLQAGILLAKLDAFEQELEAVNSVALSYTKLLKDVITPIVEPGFFSSWAQYTIRLKDENQRDLLKKHLEKEGIQTAVYYPRGLHQQTAYKKYSLSDDLFPNTVLATKQVLSLPMHPYMEHRDVECVCKAIAEFLKGD